MSDSATGKFQLRNYDAIIFDLGGVILPLDYGKTTNGLTELYGDDASHLYTQAKQNDLFDRFERGEVSSAGFRSELCGLLAPSSVKEPTAGAVDAAWNALLGTLPDAHLRFLKELGRSKRVFLLSNTNEIHIRKFLDDYQDRHESEHGPWAALFERAYYSHEIGQRKPESRIYQGLIDAHGLTPGRTLFLDDNPDNVRGALEVGLDAHHHPSNLPLPARFEVD